MASKAGRLLLPLMLLAGECHAAPPCADTIASLRALLVDHAFPLTWHETSMDDGNPLILTILERNGLLYLEFVKTGQGLWAESASVLCLKGENLEARFAAEQVRLGPSANWAMRYALGSGGQFTLTRMGDEQLRVATSGWSGTFSSRSKAK